MERSGMSILLQTDVQRPCPWFYLIYVASYNPLIIQLLFLDNNSSAFRLMNSVDKTIMMTYNMVMINLNINEIKTHFSSFLEKVRKGETVIVCKRNVPIAEIKPIVSLPNKKRPIGLAGKEYPDFQISDDFFEPLPDDIVAAFDGEAS